ncbi:MAG: hypothetical protein V4858_23465 [Pseudomonadota bacterium]
MPDFLINHLSIESWRDSDRWATYFAQTQEILGAQLTHLDISDPVRKKVTSLGVAGEYISSFKTREDSRWLFGKFETIGVEISIQHYRQLGHWPNSLTWHIPSSFIETPKNCERLKALFDLGNQAFKPFYAYADEAPRISSKKKTSGAVDIRAELLGVFWMTYFNAAYVDFFGASKFKTISAAEYDANGGVTILLADSPVTVPDALRENLAAMLGERSFVDVKDLLGKQPGHFALTFQQLEAFQAVDRR